MCGQIRVVVEIRPLSGGPVPNNSGSEKVGFRHHAPATPTRVEACNEARRLMALHGTGVYRRVVVLCLWMCRWLTYLAHARGLLAISQSLGAPMAWHLGAAGWLGNGWLAHSSQKPQHAQMARHVLMAG